MDNYMVILQKRIQAPLTEKKRKKKNPKMNEIHEIQFNEIQTQVSIQKQKRIQEIIKAMMYGTKCISHLNS